MRLRLAIVIATGSFTASLGCGSPNTSPANDSGADGPGDPDASANDAGTQNANGDASTSDAIATGAGCSTGADPGGCNCPNSGAAHVYTLDVAGDPAACGLHASPADNSDDLCRSLCGGCYPQLDGLGASCQLIAGSPPKVQCNTTCPPA